MDTNNELTLERVNRIKSAIVEYDRFIIKEEARGADLRPAKVQELLDKYKAKKVELELALITSGTSDETNN